MARISKHGRGSGAPVSTPTEKLWALFYSGEGGEFQKLLQTLQKADQSTLEGQFCLLWMTLRSHGMSEAIAWAAPGALMPEVIAARERLVHACVSMLVDAEGFRFSEDELRQLGRSKVMRTAAIWDVTDKLKGKQRYHEALALGEGLPRQTMDKLSIYSLFLARIAESTEDWKLTRHYLQEAVNAPLLPEAYRSRFDTFLSSFSSLQRVAGSSPNVMRSHKTRGVASSARRRVISRSSVRPPWKVWQAQMRPRRKSSAASSRATSPPRGR